MAYGTYDPGITYNPGPIGAGLASMGQSLNEGLKQYAQKQKEKEQEDKANKAVENLLTANPEVAKSLGVDPSDPKAWKVGVESLGGPVNAIKFSQVIQEQKAAKKLADQEAEIAAAKLAGINEENARHTRNQKAALGVFAQPKSGLEDLQNPFNAQVAGTGEQSDIAGNIQTRVDQAAALQPGPGTRVARYVSQGGDDPAMLKTLEGLDAIDEKKKEPKMGEHIVHLPNGHTGFVDANGNFHDLAEKDVKDKLTEVTVAGKKRYLLGTHLLDENAQPFTPQKELNPLIAQQFTGNLQSDLEQIQGLPTPGIQWPFKKNSTGWYQSAEEIAQKKARLEADASLMATQLGGPKPDFGSGATAAPTVTPAAPPTTTAPTPATTPTAPAAGPSSTSTSTATSTAGTTPAGPKLYTIDKTSNKITFDPNADIRDVLTQLVRDGQLTDAKAREILSQQNFAKRGGK